MRKWAYVPLVAALIFGIYLVAQLSSAQAQVASSDSDPKLVALGKAIFFDENLSVNGKQSCATCHGPGVGFTGPDPQVNATGAVYPGAIPNRFGNRKPPASAYAGDSPTLHYDEAAGAWFGGMFWDGRATGATLGDPLAEQAQGPFLNPLEQAMPDAHVLAAKVAQSDYADLFREVWGPDSLDFARDVNGVYERIARSVAAYERSPEVNPFTSKFDQFWDNAETAGKDVTKIRGGAGMGGGGMGGGNTDPNRWQTYRGLGLGDQELMGLAAFNDPNRANCASCHSLQAGPAVYPLFTDFGYDNVGMPKNPENPFYRMPKAFNRDGQAWIDEGLGGYLRAAGFPAGVYGPELGKVKVPTLRNVDKRPSESFVKAYGHNGFFDSLELIVRFYAWRGMMDGNCGGMGGGMGGGCGGMGGGGMGGGMCGGDCANMFPPPEVDQNRATLKHFNMMDQANIVTFLKTLSDGYFTR